MMSDYVAPPAAPHAHLTASLESSAGRVVLRPNRYGHGFKLHADAEGFGAADVDNDLISRLGRRGAMLGEQRETEGDMFLPIIIKSTSNTEVRRLVAELTAVLQRAKGTLRVVMSNPATGDARYRDVVYREGLRTPDWTSPVAVRYGLTFDYMDPWAYSTQLESVSIPVAPGASGGLQVPIRVPISFARSGATADRWGTNGGDNPAPVILRFNGPVTDPEVSLQGHWTFRVRGSLQWDEYLEIDPTNLSEPTAYVYSTTQVGSRRAAQSMIRTGSRFTDLVMPPGRHAFTFRAIDPTYTASMTASWPHTYAAMY